MVGLDVIFSDGREISEAELESLEQKIDQGLYSIELERYVRCANPDDPDYKHIPDRDCEGTIELDSTASVCDYCDRRINNPQGKTEYSRQILHLNRNKIRDYIRTKIKSSFDTGATTISRTYCGTEISYILNVESPNVNLFIVFEVLGRETVKWCKVYNENPVFVLIGDGNQLSNQLSELNIPYFSFSDLVSGEFKQPILAGDIGPLADRDLCAKISYNLCSNREVLERMAYDEFERSVQNLLLSMIGTSSLLGSTEAGTGVPDGLLTLNHSNPPRLFMWDAKFIDYRSSNKPKTDLKSEYDKIFRHRTSVESVPSIDKRFDAVEGVVLFTPGIKEANVSRLAEFMEENDFLHNNSWNGTVCYFKFDALLHLYNRYSRDDFDVQNKYRGLNATLFRFMTSSSKHESDTKIVEETENCVEIDSKDVDRIFDKIKRLGTEQTDVPTEEYLAYLDVVSE